MPVGKKLAVVLSVVIIGASVALFFRKDASVFRFWRTGPDDPFAHPVERRVTADAAWAHRGPGAKADARSEPARRVPAVATAAIAEPTALGGQPTFDNKLNPVGALLPPIDGIADEQDTDFADGWTTSGQRSASPAGQALRHVVVDGDTLSNLAARYLGRAEAYLEIFECNRDLLASPDLLPIGAVLTIPSGRPGDDQSARRGGSFAPEASSGLVPVRGNPG